MWSATSPSRVRRSPSWCAARNCRPAWPRFRSCRTGITGADTTRIDCRRSVARMTSGRGTRTGDFQVHRSRMSLSRARQSRRAFPHAGYGASMAAGGRGGVLAARTPDINAGEQEQPDHVDKMPVPSCELEAEMLLGAEMAEEGTDQAHGQEDRADDHVGAMEASRHEEGGTVDVAFVVERSVAVLVGLHGREGEAEQDGKDEAPFEPLPVILQERVMRPGDRGARGEQDQRVEQRQVPRIEGVDALGGPHAAEQVMAQHLVRVARKQRRIEKGPEP